MTQLTWCTYLCHWRAGRTQNLGPTHCAIWHIYVPYRIFPIELSICHSTVTILQHIYFRMAHMCAIGLIEGPMFFSLAIFNIDAYFRSSIFIASSRKPMAHICAIWFWQCINCNVFWVSFKVPKVTYMCYLIPSRVPHGTYLCHFFSILPMAHICAMR